MRQVRRRQKMKGIDHALKALTDLCRKQHGAMEWPVMDGKTTYRAGFVAGDHGHAVQLNAAEGPCLPLHVLAAAVRRLIGKDQSLIDLAGRFHDLLDVLATAHGFM